MLKISIITPVLNNEKTIKDTLESVKNQTYPNIEHIIIDGNSTDNSISFIKEYNHVKKLISEKDSGIYHAMNKGLTLATGDIIGILNADDFYTHNAVIQNVISAFENEKTDTVYADLVFISPQDDSKIVRYWKAGTFSKTKMLYGWTPPHPTFFVKNAIYKKYGYFNSAFEIAGDYELMLRFLYKYQVSTCYLPEVIVKMRVGGKSSKSIKNRIKTNSEDRLAWKVNGLKPTFLTTFLKPLRKLTQFFINW